MKIMVLLILLCVFHGLAYGDIVMEPYVTAVIPDEADIHCFEAAGRVGPTEISARQETEVLGDIVKYLLSDVKCEVIRDIDLASQRAVDASI